MNRLEERNEQSQVANVQSQVANVTVSNGE